MSLPYGGKNYPLKYSTGKFRTPQETVYLKIPYINVSLVLGTSQGLEECFWELGFEQNMVWDSGKCKTS